MPPALARAASDDRDILELLRAGEHQRAFAQLLDRYERKVYRLCCAVLRDPTTAQDVAQESLLRLWRALGRYDGRASLSTWIYVITRNRCRTALERRRQEASLDELDPATETEAAGGVPQEAEDRYALLRELVELLPERYRSTLTLYYYEERSVSEVAAMLATPENTVKTHLHRARAALLEHLRHRGLADPGAWLEDRP
ncbi:MAG TPA: sigma-70 family RNA polymerase sigma factor [Steroidobacteraceae bacterium]|jgi:RNA polymerase sigma-70 factor (ECF subfamily)|nr:sigma-70 family RNA polymerase sigma factor [Steroidobacteraceae bacterium]